MDISERKLKILAAIVETYVKTGEPGGFQGSLRGAGLFRILSHDTK